LISGELLFGGYIAQANVAKVKAMLESRFVSKEYLSRTKAIVNETDRIEQETARTSQLLNSHRKWLHAQPGVLYISVGVRPPTKICLCVGGSLSPELQQSIRDRIGEDVCFEELSAVVEEAPQQGQKPLSR
jgi:hypothetical protein